MKEPYRRSPARKAPKSKRLSHWHDFCLEKRQRAFHAPRTMTILQTSLTTQKLNVRKLLPARRVRRRQAATVGSQNGSSPIP